MIRKLKQADITECINIVQLNWSVPVAERFKREVAHAFNESMAWPPEYFVFETDGNVIAGFAGMIQSWRMHNTWDLIWINVHPEYQGEGIGKRLTLHRMDEIHDRGGAVISLMTKEKKFFKKLGFKKDREYIGGWISMSLQIRELVI
jgi:ribosomal protein S18 acetylase RimI-like enzyme